MQNQKTLVELEALRGIAALVVLLHHFMLGFTTRLHGLLYPDQPWSLMGTPAYAFVNGSAAVIVFFVLSGFVLTDGILAGKGAYKGIISALKRWPRLAATVMLANAIAGAFAALGLFGNVQVSKLIPSIWLGWFYTWTSAGVSEIAFGIWEGASTFFTGASNYNSSLWTMTYEFWGSLVSIASSIVCLRFKNLTIRYLFLIAVWIVCLKISPLISSFIVGIAIAQLKIARPDFRITSRSFLILFSFLVLLCLGFNVNAVSSRAEGIYGVLNPLVSVDPVRTQVIFHSAAAAILMSIFLWEPNTNRLMSGQVGRRLGFMSFGIYLAQVLVICSASSWVYQHTIGTPRTVQLGLTFVVTLFGTIALAVPLAFFDRWWVQRLNTLTDRLRGIAVR